MDRSRLDVEELARLAERLAVEAGALVAAGRADHGPGQVDTKSSSTDLVTEHDRASEALITRVLAEVRPHDGILGEEGAATAGTSGITWIVDPIDGTTNFFYGLPGYAVSVAAADERGALVGAVHTPVWGDTWTAVRGAGARCNGRPVRCRANADLATSLIATGFGYEADRRALQARSMAVIAPRVRDLRRFGAASVDLCFSGDGRVDAYFEIGLKPWDLAAGGLVAAEGGCAVTDFAGGPPGEQGVVAANPVLHERLLALLDEARAGDAYTAG